MSDSSRPRQGQSPPPYTYRQYGATRTRRSPESQPLLRNPSDASPVYPPGASGSEENTSLIIEFGDKSHDKFYSAVRLAIYAITFIVALGILPAIIHTFREQDCANVPCVPANELPPQTCPEPVKCPEPMKCPKPRECPKPPMCPRLSCAECPQPTPCPKPRPQYCPPPPTCPQPPPELVAPWLGSKYVITEGYSNYAITYEPDGKITQSVYRPGLKTQEWHCHGKEGWFGFTNEAGTASAVFLGHCAGVFSGPTLCASATEMNAYENFVIIKNPDKKGFQMFMRYHDGLRPVGKDREALAMVKESDIWWKFTKVS
ncbi:hypothetical protein ABW20_dc0106277 [Dactylellina cionopaga]|nr:hypothetical protein ABW20_dc0106277 [Dactylellina cionopaga]